MAAITVFNFVYFRELLTYSPADTCLTNGQLDKSKCYFHFETNDYLDSDEINLDLNSNHFDNCSNCDCDCDCKSQINNPEMDSESMESFEEFIRISILISEYHVEVSHRY